MRKKIKALPKPSYDICFARIAKIPRIREIRGANGGFVAVAMNRGEFASQTDDKSEVSPAAREPSRSIALSLSSIPVSVPYCSPTSRHHRVVPLSFGGFSCSADTPTTDRGSRWT